MHEHKLRNYAEKSGFSTFNTYNSISTMPLEHPLWQGGEPELVEALGPAMAFPSSLPAQPQPHNLTSSSQPPASQRAKLY